MSFKVHFLRLCLAILTLTFFFACGQNKNSIEPGERTSEMASGSPNLTIDTFSTFPPVIDGCSCYFSNDSTEFEKGEYIYMNDLNKISFLKVNGVLIKFT